MKISKRIVLSGVALASLGILLPAMRAPLRAPMRAPIRATLPFKDARLKIELNATAGDAGIQMFADAEPWDRFMIEGPNGFKLIDVKGKGNLGDLGMTELFWESHEPAFDDLPLADLLNLFPEGNYQFIGTAKTGERIASTAVFTHDIPDGAVVVSPPDGSVQDPAHTVVDWEPVTTPPGIQIAEYEVIVELVDPKRVLSVHVPGSVTSLTVPPEFLESGEDYIFEVLAIEVGGNQTIVEGFFSTL